MFHCNMYRFFIPSIRKSEDRILYNRVSKNQGIHIVMNTEIPYSTSGKIPNCSRVLYPTRSANGPINESEEGPRTCLQVDQRVGTSRNNTGRVFYYWQPVRCPVMISICILVHFPWVCVSCEVIVKFGIAHCSSMNKYVVEIYLNSHRKTKEISHLLLAAPLSVFTRIRLQLSAQLPAWDLSDTAARGCLRQTA